MPRRFNIDYPDWWDESCDDYLEDALKLILRNDVFKPHNTWMHYPDGRFEFVPNGWDHEHCHFPFCDQKISPYDGDEQTGYVDESGKIWFCTDCYERYILPALKG